MCNGNCYGYEPEELTSDDQKAILLEKQKILEAKLATVQYMIKSLDDQKTSDTK